MSSKLPAYCPAMASQMQDDERLARQLQDQELSQVAMVNTVPVTGVVQGMPVAGQGGNGAQGQGYGGQAYTGPSGTPTVIGIGQPGSMPYGVAVVPDIPSDESTVLSYRFSLLCFSIIDAVSTMLNAIAAARTFFADGDDAADSDEQQSNVFGNTSFVKNKGLSQTVGLLALIFLVGPICGYMGARSFNRGLVAVYLVFCVAKTIFEAALAFLSPYLWYILIALVQIWVTKIVYTFWSALGRITPEKIVMLRDPNYVHNLPQRYVYW